MIESRVRDLVGVLAKKRIEYFIWLLANLGGLLVAYSATLTIWVFHLRAGSLVPGPEVFLITSALSVAVAGVSYLNVFHENRSLLPSPLFLLGWPFLVTAVYGVLISMGVEKPLISDTRVWLITVALFGLCLVWASVTWLHQQGLLRDQEEPPAQAPAPAPALNTAAGALPKLGPNAQPAAGGDQDA
jgi:hypothetical protein